MSATKLQLKEILADVESLGFNLSNPEDKASVYSHIACNESSYELSNGDVIEDISIKQLFWMYFNTAKPGRLKAKS